MLYSKNLMVLGLLCLGLSGCRNYQLSPQSLMQQLAASKAQNKVNFITGFPLIFPGEISGNSLRELVVLDKKNNTHILFVTNHTGVTITKKRW